MFRVKAFASFLFFVTIASVLGAPANAVDGVIEINQATVDAAGGPPFTIVASGSYRLTGNLTVPDVATDGILVNANFVTLDLNGFSISGPAGCSGTGSGGGVTCTSTGSGIGVNAIGRTGTALVNGTVSGMGAEGLNLGTYARAERLRVIANGGSGIDIGTGGVIANSTIAGNKGHGAQLGWTTGSVPSDCIARNNEIFGNDGDGINSTGDGNLILHNRISDNRLHGIVLGGDGGLLIGNVIRGSGLSGLFLSNASSGYGANVLTGNTGGDSPGAGTQLGDNLCTSALCP